MAQIIDDRKGWRERVITNDIDINTLSDKWDKIKAFVNDRPTCDIVIRLEAGDAGKLFVKSSIGDKAYDLSIKNDGTVQLF